MNVLPYITDSNTIRTKSGPPENVITAPEYDQFSEF